MEYTHRCNMEKANRQFPNEAKLLWQFRTGADTKEESLKRAKDIYNKFNDNLIKIIEDPNYINTLKKHQDFYINAINMVSLARTHKTDIKAIYDCPEAADAKFPSYISITIYIELATKKIVKNSHVISIDTSKKK